VVVRVIDQGNGVSGQGSLGNRVPWIREEALSWVDQVVFWVKVMSNGERDPVVSCGLIA
jgi:hypothetical protein